MRIGSTVMRSMLIPADSVKGYFSLTAHLAASSNLCTLNRLRMTYYESVNITLPYIKSNTFSLQMHKVQLRYDKQILLCQMLNLLLYLLQVMKYYQASLSLNVFSSMHILIYRLIYLLSLRNLKAHLSYS
jgi:hypothetical protein